MTQAADHPAGQVVSNSLHQRRPTSRHPSAGRTPHRFCHPSSGSCLGQRRIPRCATATLEPRRQAPPTTSQLSLAADAQRLLALADRIVGVTFSLHEAPARADRDACADAAQAAHNAFVAAVGPLV
ncbi:hypothetical protein BN159_p83 (plasmid) [Streptomyces davaonensis JCM 4913]|uniref:Uncharacterized protein n=1 Tax=Streptomyces davaonensis (strain DSM 101723 / JCM 4913 / KCC S-0913 / 768) TaxID=1214101 RepID=K4R9K2_STRDJ|nr:hypothetical protein BN159_p83 [Streptomyces davaonensis JCM 4913]